MSNSVEAISVKYLTTKKLSGGTRKKYKSTVTKWSTDELLPKLQTTPEISYWLCEANA